MNARWFLSALVALAVVHASPSPARACSNSPVSTSLLDRWVPVGGPLIVMVTCAGDGAEVCATGSVGLTVSDAGLGPDAGAPVPGTLETLRDAGQMYLAWTPDAPLEAGRTYEVVTDETARFEQPLAVIATSDLSFSELALDTLTPSLTTTWVPVGERYCCGGGMACFPSCYTEQEQLVADVGFSWLETAPDVIVRTRFVDADGQQHESGWLPARTRTGVRLSHPAPTYCVTLEVGSLLDANVRSREFCQDARDPNVGDHRPRELGAESFYDCGQPPGTTCDGAECTYASPTLRDAWCAAKSEYCDGDSGVYTCTNVGQHCPSVVLAPESKQGDDGTSGGCSCTVGRRTPRHVPLALSMAALGVAVFRPRRRRCARAPDPRRGRRRFSRGHQLH